MKLLFALKLSALMLVCSQAQVPYAPGHGPEDEPRLAAEKIAANHMAGYFAPSLEAREATDFLLTPALVVQNLNPKGVVQFDALIRLKRQISKSDVTIFARYWVASNRYSVGVVWAEPNGRFLEFPVYPPSLQIVSLENAFTINHSLFTNITAAFEKPVVAPRTFTNQFGDYPIASIRFAEARLPNSPWIGALKKRASSTIQGQVTREKIPAMPLNLALSGDGVRIGFGGTNYHVLEIPGIDLRGGRIFETAWKPAEFGFDGSVPASVSLSLTNGTLLYEARLSGFCAPVDLANDVKKACRGFAGFGEDDLRYRVLLDRYWKKSPGDVSSEDRIEAQKLIARYVSAGDRQCTVGEKIKRLNILMELNRVVGDEGAYLRHLQKYLGELKTHGLEETMLLGGLVAVDTLTIWKRTGEAKKAMEVWINNARAVNPDSIIAFAERELERENLATTFCLLERARQSAPSEYKQTFKNLRAKTVQRILAFTADPKIHEGNEIAEGQLALLKLSVDIAALADEND